jgi:hydroxyethylthiazole kinase-like uncharacterized protein yjeF
MELVTAAEMRALDQAAIQERHIPGLRLMENAGQAVVGAMEREFGSLRGKTITVIAGKGQNAGDGFVVARLLRQRRCKARVVLLTPAGSLKGDAATTLRKYIRGGGRCYQLKSDSPTLIPSLFDESDVLVDAIFGTGLNAPVEGLAANTIRLMNESGLPIVAIDLPSGLSADTGETLGPTIHAALTVTLAQPKRGLYLGDGPNFSGTVCVGDIGIPADLVARAKVPVSLLDSAMVRAVLPHRDPTAHKGSFGHAVIIAGSTGKTGAAAMAGFGALRIGAGLVTIAVPRTVNDAVEAKLLEAMTFPVDATQDGTFAKSASAALLTFVQDKNAVAVGPGVGRHSETAEMIRALVIEIRQPIVLDADGINAMAGHRQLFRQVHAPVIMTPHPGEMARFLDTTTTAVQQDRLGIASRVARELNIYVVLKGAGTVIAAPDGALAVNSTGNPGMATGGTGDVLTGIIAGLLAQRLSPWHAACAGVYLHGFAGDLAAASRGQMGLIARDVIEAIPSAIQHVLHEPSPSER